jgi:hypothetical protein
VAGALHQVSAIDPSREDPDEHLIADGLRLRCLDDIGRRNA